MNTILVITLALGVVSADIGLDFKYKVPHTSYGVPSYQTGGGSSDYSSGFAGDSAGANEGEYQGSSFGQQNSGYLTGSHATSSFGGANSGSGYQTGNRYQTGSGAGGQYYYPASSTNTGVSSGATAQPSFQFSGGSAQGGYQTFDQYQTSSQYQSSALQNYKEYYNQLQQQPAQVFKHFYVHAAPEEPEPQRNRQPIVLPPPQKHYKIIFIKTPSQPAYPPQLIPIPQQNEEKTIVYVLLNKPEQPQDVFLPKIEQKPPTKPEVFFINYKNKEDSQAVINNIVNDYNKGESVSFTGSGARGSGGVSSGGQYQLGASSGQHAQSGGSEQYVPTGNSGLFTQPGNSGLFTQPGNSGLFTQPGNSGLFTQPGNSGLYTQSGNSGQYSTQSGDSGKYLQSGNSGQYSPATGDLTSLIAGSQAAGQVSSGSDVSQAFPVPDGSSSGSSSIAASGVGSVGSISSGAAISSATSVNVDSTQAVTEEYCDFL